MVLEELDDVLEHLDGLPRLLVHLLVGASDLGKLHVHRPPGLVELLTKLLGLLFVPCVVNLVLNLGKLRLVASLGLGSLLDVKRCLLAFGLSCLLFLTFAIV